MTKTIVVTGATGQVGGTVVEALAGKGFRIRAATREPGNYRGGREVTPVKLDYHKPASIDPALAGADGLFLIALPLDSMAPEVLAPVINRAGKSGVKHIVLHSALGVDRHEEAPLRQVELYLMASGVPYTILRSNFFMDNFVTGSLAPMIKEKDGIFLPAGKGRTSFIATRDIAAVAAAAFKQGLAGRDFNLTGPESLDHHQVAEIIGEAVGRTITYHPVSEEDFLVLSRERGLPEPAVRYLAGLYALVRDGRMARLTRDVFEVTGREPMHFGDFAAEHAGDWQPLDEAALTYASRTLTGRPGAHLSK
jgi:uncharacterized protein YbjT (DUF2867 family)